MVTTPLMSEGLGVLCGGGGGGECNGYDTTHVRGIGSWGGWGCNGYNTTHVWWIGSFVGGNVMVTTPLMSEGLAVLFGGGGAGGGCNGYNTTHVKGLGGLWDRKFCGGGGGGGGMQWLQHDLHIYIWSNGCWFSLIFFHVRISVSVFVTVLRTGYLTGICA